MEDTLKRALLLALVAGGLAVVQWVVRRYFPRQAAWLSHRLGERQRKLGWTLALAGLLSFVLVFVVKVFVLRSHQLSPPWWVAFWAGVGVCASGMLLVVLEALFGKNQSATGEKEQR
jgi:MFS family permease